jgi:alpha-L-fucosidase
MNRRRFLISGSGLTAGALFNLPFLPGRPALENAIEFPGKSKFSHRLPETDGHYLRTCGYVEDVPVAEYSWAPDAAYEDFLDMKFGIRVHWGLYSLLQLQNESWPFLTASLRERQAYQELYRAWDPVGFDADQWMGFFKESGAKMFSFTTKHHDGFSMYDTKTRVRKRANWLSPGGPALEDCDLAYSIMETPFRRDVVKELAEAAHKENIKIDLYFSHPDWYDADFRPYTYHPLQVPDAGALSVTGKNKTPVLEHPEKRFGKSGLVVMPDANPESVKRMMQRHRGQLEELITRYGKIDMVCLDMFLGPAVWPALRETMLYLRKLRPDVMYRARGIGNYGDYYTPEGFVPGSKENTDVPWFVIYPLGGTFSYEPAAEKYKGTKWVVHNLIDAVAKGGNFMAGIGPDGSGRFHPEAIAQLRQAGSWLKINGEGIYATRAREGDLWKQGDQIRYTRSKDNKAVYAFAFEWPGEQLILQTVKPGRKGRVFLMGDNRALPWKHDGSRGLVIDLPAGLRENLSPAAQIAYGFKIEI